MRRGVARFVLLALFVVGGTKCSLGALDGFSSGAPASGSTDSAALDSSGDGAGSSSSSSSSGDANPSCRLPTLPANPDLVSPTNIDSRWTLSGSATASDEGITLTPEQNERSGAIFWSVPFYFDKVDVTFDFIIRDANGDLGDGLAFVWSKGAVVPAAGGTSNDLGIPRQTGYAVVIDTFRDTSDPVSSAPFLAVIDSAKPIDQSFLTASAVPVSINDVHTLRVVLDAPNVTVMLDNATRINNFTIAGYVPFKGYWGLTAATGGIVSKHIIRNVRATLPAGGGCVE